MSVSKETAGELKVTFNEKNEGSDMGDKYNRQEKPFEECKVESRNETKLKHEDLNVHLESSFYDKSILPDVRDKGYAWVTIAVMFVCSLVTNGYMRAIGIIFNAISQHYPGTSATAGGLLITLLSVMRNLSAAVIAAAAVQFGARTVMICGAIICSTAFMATFFCTNAAQISLTLGALMGIGLSSLETPQVHVLSSYFNDKKELADAIRVSANSLGGVVLPLLFVSVEQNFGFKLSFVLLSAFMLQLIVFIVLIQEYEVRQVIAYESSVRKSMREGGSENLKRLTNKNSPLNIDRRTRRRVKEKRYDFMLLKNPIYLFYVGMIFCWSIVNPHCFFYVLVYARSIYLTPSETSLVMMYQSLLDFVSRIVIGILIHKKRLTKPETFVTCLCLSGLALIFLPCIHDLTGFIFAITLIGLGNTGFYSCLTTMIIDDLGHNRATSAYGLLRMIQGCLNLGFPFLIGFLVDVYGTFTPTFAIMGSSSIMAGLFILLKSFYLARNKQKTEKN